MYIAEFSNRIIGLINKWLHVFYKYICTITEIICLKTAGVTIGKSLEFRGWTSIFRRHGSIIKIGNNCCFNSCSYFNHIGLNRMCSITTMDSCASIIIGDNLGMSSSTITSFNSIVIGNNVKIGANCTIMDGDFHLEDPRSGIPKPIVIEDNVWLGANVVVLKGVTIGRNSIVGMNSLVTKDIPANSVAAGNPCKVIRALNEKVINKLNNI